MPAKKATTKRTRETTCPTSVAMEPTAADVNEQACCQGACPIEPPSVAVAPEDPNPVDDGASEQITATGDNALENETEIVVEKPAKKSRKTTKKKDAGEPKPPKAPNAYMLFYQDELKKDAYTGITLPERAKMIGALWRQMDDSARAPFKERVAKAKEALTASD